jgi:hypothetical protein
MCLVIEGGAEIFKQDHKHGSKRIGQRVDYLQD